MVTNGMNLRIKPNVDLIKENLRVRSQTIGVDTKSGWNISPVRIITAWNTPVDQVDVDRCIGWEVRNYAVKYDLRMEFNLYSKYSVVKFPDPATPQIQIPNVQIDDITIDSDLTGDTGATINVQSENDIDAWFSDLWTDYWYIIIAVIVIFLGIATVYINGATGNALGQYVGAKIRSKLNSDNK